MPLLPDTNPDYTDKDFDSLRLRLQNLIRSVFPEWTDFNAATFGNILVDLFAHAADVIAFYVDASARQSRILSATDRRALLGLVKLINYRPSTASPATVDVTISLPAAPAADVLWPAGTVVTTEGAEPIEYRLLTDATITAGADPAEVTVSAENSQTQTQGFTSTGLANQSVSLTAGPYIDGSAIVVAGNGPYIERADLLSSTASDLHYTTTVDQNDRARVRFGNGINGQLPIGNGTITYKTGGGSAGRVEAGRIKRIPGAWTDANGNTVLPTITNAQPSSGGLDRETVAQIKARAPASIRAPTNCVAREDFEIHAREVAGVARALMLTSNEDPGIDENTGILYVVPEGGGLPSQALKDAVLTQVTVTYPCTLTFNVYVQDPLYYDINIYATVYLRAGVVAATARTAIIAALDALFAITLSDGTPNESIGFGAEIQEVVLSDVQNAIRDVAGVRKVGAGVTDITLNGVHNDVALQAQAFPRIGTLTLINGDSGAPL